MDNQSLPGTLSPVHSCITVRNSALRAGSRPARHYTPHTPQVQSMTFTNLPGTPRAPSAASTLQLHHPFQLELRRLLDTAIVRDNTAALAVSCLQVSELA
jgi:hypothetical protein